MKKIFSIFLLVVMFVNISYTNPIMVGSYSEVNPKESEMVSEEVQAQSWAAYAAGFVVTVAAFGAGYYMATEAYTDAPAQSTSIEKVDFSKFDLK